LAELCESRWLKRPEQRQTEDQISIMCRREKFCSGCQLVATGTDGMGAVSLLVPRKQSGWQTPAAAKMRPVVLSGDILLQRGLLDPVCFRRLIPTGRTSMSPQPLPHVDPRSYHDLPQIKDYAHRIGKIKREAAPARRSVCLMKKMVYSYGNERMVSA